MLMHNRLHHNCGTVLLTAFCSLRSLLSWVAVDFSIFFFLSFAPPFPYLPRALPVEHEALATGSGVAVVVHQPSICCEHLLTEKGVCVYIHSEGMGLLEHNEIVNNQRTSIKVRGDNLASD